MENGQDERQIVNYSHFTEYSVVSTHEFFRACVLFFSNQTVRDNVVRDILIYSVVIRGLATVVQGAENTKSVVIIVVDGQTARSTGVEVAR